MHFIGPEGPTTMLKIIVLGCVLAVVATAPRSGDRDHAFAKSAGRPGAALSAMNSRRFPPPWSVEDTGACYVVKDSG
jgi:hypothetical protein